ncbi:hypothetical protein BDV96DRAFT_255062 [Lophiotrema nucula]|uniref:Uncharacterized protein n=1 Tax=Lophiotrema nucula TaxID=690887 RepID=A0A6A5YPJ4_9PLEO|nr:hypothetical protein BDV96DRAFT_255062 [Lophiotrema nucula]
MQQRVPPATGYRWLADRQSFSGVAYRRHDSRKKGTKVRRLVGADSSEKCLMFFVTGHRG